jgi:hypothetical protein
MLKKKEITCRECEEKYDAIMWVEFDYTEGICPDCLENMDRE